MSALKALDTLILAVGIDVTDSDKSKYFDCMLEDTDEHYFGVSDFDELASLVDDISSIVCSDEIELVINEVGVIPNVSARGDDLFFIEVYNPSVGVSLSGFNFTGMIAYTIDETSCMAPSIYIYLS